MKLADQSLNQRNRTTSAIAWPMVGILFYGYNLTDKNAGVSALLPSTTR